MTQQRLPTGMEVPAGIYRCNACAKQIDCREDECTLPQCSACGYQVKAVCPHCSCGTVDDMSAEEIKARTIDGENLEVNCPECMEVHRANIRSACPDYADECHL